MVGILARQGGETDKAYEACQRYLEMGPFRRSLAALCEQLERPRGYVRTLKGWSSRWSWALRCAEYDASQAAGRQERTEQARGAVVDAITAHLEQLISAAQSIMKGDFSDASKARVQLDAVKMALGILGLSPTARVEARVHHGGSVSHHHTAMTEAQRAEHRENIERMSALPMVVVDALSWALGAPMELIEDEATREFIAGLFQGATWVDPSAPGVIEVTSDEEE